MRCKNVKDRLDDHVDGLLAAPEAEAVRDHLDDCTDCRETSQALSAASSSLSHWHDAEPPADCFAKILQRIDSLPPEALHRPAPTRRLLPRLPRIESVRSARARWFATSGLAAAAAVLSAVLLSQAEPRTQRRAPRPMAPALAGMSAASWYQGYDFDNGLYYSGRGRAATQPVRAAWRLDELDGSPK
jgi:anti-sigma factor RsiW